MSPKEGKETMPLWFGSTTPARWEITLWAKLKHSVLNVCSAEGSFCCLFGFVFLPCVSGAALLKKRWITLSPTSASLWWIRPWQLLLSQDWRHPLCDTYMCVKCFKCSNILRCMFSISIPSMLLENTKHMSFVSKHHTLFPSKCPICWKKNNIMFVFSDINSHANIVIALQLILWWLHFWDDAPIAMSHG